MTRPTRRELEREIEDLQESTPTREFERSELTPEEKHELDQAIQNMIEMPTRVDRP